MTPNPLVLYFILPRNDDFRYKLGLRATDEWGSILGTDFLVAATQWNSKGNFGIFMGPTVRSYFVSLSNLHWEFYTGN